MYLGVLVTILSAEQYNNWVCHNCGWVNDRKKFVCPNCRSSIRSKSRNVSIIVENFNKHGSKYGWNDTDSRSPVQTFNDGTPWG